MQEFNSDIDTITDQVAECILRMYNELQQLDLDINADYSRGAAIIAFRIGLDYFSAARDAMHKGLIISGGSLLRSALENLADLFYLYDKPGKYPKAYVESMERFRLAMVDAANKSTHALAASRELKQANKWTDASIEDRIKASGNSLVNIYDMFSYFSHPNPGSLTYVIHAQLKAKQLNLMKQANCMTALTLMNVVLRHSDLKAVDPDELNVLAKKLGMSLAEA